MMEVNKSYEKKVMEVSKKIEGKKLEKLKNTGEKVRNRIEEIKVIKRKKFNES